MKVYKSKWDESYSRNENNIFYPKEEVVKFINRFVCKKIDHNKYKKSKYFNNTSKLKGLDYGCGIGSSTALLDEFNIDSYGVDISQEAISKAKEIYTNLQNKFYLINGLSLPFDNSFFDLIICESVIDSMHFDVAKTVIKEIDRVTKKFLFISFIAGESTEKIVDSDFENGTVQSYYNWSKINQLLDHTNFKVIWAQLHSRESLLNSYKYGRFYLVCEK